MSSAMDIYFKMYAKMNEVVCHSNVLYFCNNYAGIICISNTVDHEISANDCAKTKCDTKLLRVPSRWESILYKHIFL